MAKTSRGKGNGAGQNKAPSARDGVLPERKPLPTTPDLQGPRLPPWGDLIAAERRHLRADLRRPPRPSRWPEGLDQVADQDSTLPSYVYRYTRGAELTNDEMGYGELVDEPFWIVGEDRKVSAKKRSSQRTKTGRQVLLEPLGTGLVHLVTNVRIAATKGGEEEGLQGRPDEQRGDET